MIEPDAGVVYLFGPLTVLSAMFMSMASSAIWSRNVGETSCGWRVSYSPDGRAFGIWGLIYAYTFGSVVAQCTGLVVVLEWWTNFLWALAWVGCAFWVPLFDAEYKRALLSAAIVISLAAGCALGGVWHAQLWNADTAEQRLRQLAIGAPLILLAGWLFTATSIGWGITFKAYEPGAYATCVPVPPKRQDETQQQYRYRRRVLYRESYTKAPVVISLVPLMLAIVLGGLAVAIPAPGLTTPLLWAVLNLRGFPSVVYVASVVVALCGSALGVLRIFVW